MYKCGCYNKAVNSSAVGGSISTTCCHKESKTRYKIYKKSNLVADYQEGATAFISLVMQIPNVIFQGRFESHCLM